MLIPMLVEAFSTLFDHEGFPDFVHDFLGNFGRVFRACDVSDYRVELVASVGRPYQKPDHFLQPQGVSFNSSPVMSNVSLISLNRSRSRKRPQFAAVPAAPQPARPRSGQQTPVRLNREIIMLRRFYSSSRRCVR
jgi:hypothetical protein